MAKLTLPESRADIGAVHPGNESTDEEKKEELHVPTADPFGSEEQGEVKYRTMKWWYVWICSTFP